MPEYKYEIYAKDQPPRMMNLFDAPDDAAAETHAERRAKSRKDMGLDKGCNERLTREGKELPIFDRPI